MSALVYAALLGWRTNANGVVTAAAFAVGFLFATFALAGVVPANINFDTRVCRPPRGRFAGADHH